MGDKVKLAFTEEFVAREKQSGSSDISVNDVEVEIIGIFNILTEQSDKNTLAQSELYENYIYSDIASFKELYSVWPAAMQEFGDGYSEADFFVTDPEQLSNIMNEVADISSINWNNFNLPMTKYIKMHTIRKLGKSLLMLFILLILSTLVLTCLSISSSTETAA